MTQHQRSQLRLDMENAVHTLIEGVTGSIPEGMKKTPQRVVKAWDEMFSGYAMDPKEILSATFEDDGIALYKGMVIVQDIPFHSNCEHHILPFFGTADVGYIPEDRVVGLSKLARLVDCFREVLAAAA